jgi:hypothetical protein
LLVNLLIDLLMADAGVIDLDTGVEYRSMGVVALAAARTSSRMLPWWFHLLPHR